MKGAFAIAAAEIRQHRIVLWAAPIIGLLPLLGQYATERPSLHPAAGGPLGLDPSSVSGQEFFVWAAAWVVSIAVAVGLASTTVSRDLGERRLGFWLARPLPLFQYWAGKLGAAWLLAVAAGILVLLPAHLLGAVAWESTSFTLLKKSALLLRIWVTVLAFLVAGASAAAGAFQARGTLLVLNIVLVPVTWAAGWLALGRAYQAGTLMATMGLAVPYLAVATMLVLLAAGAAQVCLGRLDVRRGQILASATAWVGLLVVFAGGIEAFRWQVWRTPPTDLRFPHGVWLDAPPRGSHVLLAGSRARGVYFDAGYLIDAQGRYVRLGGQEGVATSRWSRDGRTFAWIRESLDPGGHPPLEGRNGWATTLSVWRMDSPEAPPRRHWLEHNPQLWALSSSGERALLQSKEGKQVIDVETGHVIASSDDPLPWRRPAFLSEGTVRALRTNPRRAVASPTDLGDRLGLAVSRAVAPGEKSAGPPASAREETVVDWDLESGRVTERGKLALQGSRAFFAGLTPTEDWQGVLRFDASGLYLHDIEGRLVATLVNGWLTRGNRIAGPLSGGRVGSLEEEPAGLRLRVFGSDGRLLSEARLRGRFPLRVGGEPAAGLLAIGVAPLSDEGEPATLFADLTSGNLVRREAGVSPALQQWEPERESYTPYPEPGSLGTRLFLGDDGLVSLDPSTGAKTVLVARRNRLAEN